MFHKTGRVYDYANLLQKVNVTYQDAKDLENASEAVTPTECALSLIRQENDPFFRRFNMRASKQEAGNHHF